MEREEAKKTCVELMNKHHISLPELLSALILYSIDDDKTKRKDELIEIKTFGV